MLAVLTERLSLVEISRFCFRAILVLPYFPLYFFQMLECEVFQILCPLLSFQTLEMLPVVPVFPVFSYFSCQKKRDENLAKSCSIQTAQSHVRLFAMQLFTLTPFQSKLFSADVSSVRRVGLGA